MDICNTLLTGQRPAVLPPDVAIFVRADKSANTRRCYRSDCTILSEWCRNRGLRAFPLSDVVLAQFLADQANSAGVRAQTISRRVASLKHAHRRLDLPDPVGPLTRATLAGIRNRLGVKSRPRSPLTARDLVRVVRAIPAGDSPGDFTTKSVSHNQSGNLQPTVQPTAADYRDRALLLLGFAAALRRSELVGLDLGDLRFCQRGVRITIRQSKTDQEGAGQDVAVPYGADSSVCPVRALQTWLRFLNCEGGPVFRRLENNHLSVRAERLDDASVALIVKRRAAAAGLDPGLFSAHSLRSGFLTSAAANGASLWKMMDQSRHKSVETVRRYVRDAQLFDHNAMEGLL